MMRYAVLAGCVWLSAGGVACAGVSPEVPLLEEHPVGASAGQGGGAEIDTGPWASASQTLKAEQERRELHEQVAKELGLERRLATGRGSQARMGEAVGGGGRAGSEQRSCAEVLSAHEPVSMVSGTLDFAQDGLLTVHVPGKGPVKLRADPSTCTVQAQQARLPESLLEGTEVRVSYVMENGLPTARVVHAEPVRYTR